MLGKLTREEEPDSSLDFTRGDGGPLVVVGQTGSLSSNSLKEIIDKGVHDAHGLGGDTSVRVDLLQHLVDVDGIGFLPSLLLLLLITLGDGLGSLSRLLGSFSRNFWWHGGELIGSVKLMSVCWNSWFICILPVQPDDAIQPSEPHHNILGGKIFMTHFVHF